MEKAEAMVAADVRAGFSKIHLDASMPCSDDPAILDDTTVAERAARLASVAKLATQDVGSQPVYVLGTEVPVPGGANHALDAALATIDIHREVFAKHRLDAAFERCIAFVVQPGVEFGSENVIVYNPERARELAGVLDKETGLVFEAHSTDYQPEAALASLGRDGFPILKVGPGLTFALSEALFALDLIASELVKSYSGNLATTMERLMLEHDADWKGHYHGSEEEIRLQLRHSYSDGIRYYWGLPEVAESVRRLEDALRGRPVPATLASQFMGRVADRLQPTDDVHAVVRAFVADVLQIYGRTCRPISSATGSDRSA